MGLRDWLKRMSTSQAKVKTKATDDIRELISDCTYTQPLKRLEELWGGEPQGLIRWYMVALALTTRALVCDWMIEQPNQAVDPVFRNLDIEKIDRLGAFSAWWLNDRTLGDYPEIYSNENGTIDETSKAILADFNNCLEQMYMIKDPLVNAAINKYTTAERDVIDKKSTTFAANNEQVDAIDVLMGLTPRPFDNRTTEEMRTAVERSFGITSVLVAHRSSVKEYLDKIMEREKS